VRRPVARDDVDAYAARAAARAAADAAAKEQEYEQAAAFLKELCAVAKGGPA
jgi:F0F1-type ATP synthase delta subunit